MNEEGLKLSMNEEGTWELYKEPYATIECKTEEDYDKLKAILDKATPKKPIHGLHWKSCPTCENGIGVTNITLNPRAIQNCSHCGQKLDWD